MSCGVGGASPVMGAVWSACSPQGEQSMLSWAGSSGREMLYVGYT